MATGKFSVILMHDDGRTHKIRMGHTCFHVLIVLIILAPVIGGMGIWIGWEGWHTAKTWQAEKIAFQSREETMRVRLERLTTLEALLRKNQPHLLAAAGIPNVPADKKAPQKPNTPQKTESNEPKQEAKRLETKPEKPATPDLATQNTKTTPATPVAQTPEKPNLPQGENAPNASKASSPESKTTPDSSEKSEVAQAKETQEQNEDRRKSLDTDKLRVENAQARVYDRRRIRVSADLYNTMTDGHQIGGRAEFGLLLKDGRYFPLSNDDAAFRISRFKKVVSVSPLPVAATYLDQALVILEITVDGTLIHRSSMPLTD